MDFEHRSGSGSADIALILDSRIPVIVECKSLEKKLEREKVQGLEYAQAVGAPWTLMTNGIKWELLPTFVEGVPRSKIDPVFSTTLGLLPNTIDELHSLIGKDEIDRINERTRPIIEFLQRRITEEEFLEGLSEFKHQLYTFLRSKFTEMYDTEEDFRTRIDNWADENDFDRDWTWMSRFNTDRDFAEHIASMAEANGLETSRTAIAKRFRQSDEFRLRLIILLRRNGIPVDWIDRLCFEGAYAFVNRILFLRIYEDRQIRERGNLSGISLDLLRQAESSSEARNALQVLFQRLKERFPGFYGSPIFDNVFLEDIDWDPGILIPALERTREHDFALVDRDILGEVYQHHTPKQVRKALGQFYTSPHLVRYVFDRFAEYLRPDSRVLDPACGSGSFLVEAYDRIKKLMMENGVDEGDAHGNILDDCLFGVDIDSFAIQLTIMNLLLKDLNRPVSTDNIVQGNSLTDALDRWATEESARNLIEGTNKEHSVTLDDILRYGITEGFDFVVGNPPHHPVKRSHARYGHAIGTAFADVVDGSVNIAQLFMKRALTLTARGGHFAFILPKPIIWNQSYKPLRDWIARNSRIIEITDLGKAWEEVGSEQVVLFAERAQRSNPKRLEDNEVRVVSGIPDVEYLVFGQYSEHYIRQAHFMDSQAFPIYINNPLRSDMEEVWARVEENTEELGDLTDIFRGFVRSSVRAATSDHRASPNHMPIMAGRNIGRGGFTCWSLDRETHEWVDVTHEQVTRQDKLQRMQHEKILCKRLVSSDVKVDAVMDLNGGEDSVVSFDTITNIVPTDDRISVPYLLGVLNSTLMTVYLRDIVFCRSKLTMDMDKPYIGQLPIRIPSQRVRRQMERLGVEIQDMTQTLANGAHTLETAHDRIDMERQLKRKLEQLDDTVFRLYHVGDCAELFLSLKHIPG